MQSCRDVLIRFGLLSLALLLVLHVAACDDDDDDEQRPPTTAGTSGGGETAGSTSPGDGEEGSDGEIELTDSEIAGAMLSINLAAIAQGQLAPANAADKDVLEYAARMVDDHTTANLRLSDVLVSYDIEVGGTLGSDITTESNQIVSMLEQLEGDEFDYSYISAQSSTHMKTLNLIDQSLLPNVQNEALHVELDALRSTEVAHLNNAEDLLADLLDLD